MENTEIGVNATDKIMTIFHEALFCIGFMLNMVSLLMCLESKRSGF